MSQEQTFRIILIAAALILLPIAAYHRIRSQATGEKLDRRQEGLFILFTLRPVGGAGMAGLLAYMIDPAMMAWSSVRLPEWLRWTGVGAGVMAGALMIWTLRSLGGNLTDTVVTRREHTLITRGPYRWVRHPFYDAVALSVLANSLVAANWFIFLSGALLICLIVLRTRTEEEKLVARFGDSYRAYASHTGRFIPRALSAILLLGSIGVAATLSCGRANAPEEVLLRDAIDAPEDLITRSGVTIDPEVSSDGNGSARIEASGPVTVRIAEFEPPPVEQTRLLYRARLRTLDLDGKVFLEMWCAFPGQGEYFSRALHDPLSGTVEWTTQETPFILRKGQLPSRIRLNLVVDGAGTVWIDDVVLAKAGL